MVHMFTEALESCIFYIQAFAVMLPCRLKQFTPLIYEYIEQPIPSQSTSFYGNVQKGLW